MAESNKILTVSYGTFSCTLEGFDDAFTTMKAIAEYFRDLAADDRFFGAEPPTPDADMLARLASQTAARRVEARQDDTGIVLRQEAAALDAPVRPAAKAEVEARDTVATTVAADPAPAQSEPAQSEPAEATSDVATEDTQNEELSAEDDSVTAVDHDEVVAEDTPPAPVTEDAVASEEEDTDEVAEAFAEFEAIAEAEDTVAPRPTAVAQNKTAVVTRRPKAAKAVRVQPNRPRVQVKTTRPTRATPAAAEAAPHPDQNSVAAKLARIRGVVAKTNAAEVVEGYTEDQHAEAGSAGVAADLADVFDMDQPDIEDVTQDVTEVEADLPAMSDPMPEDEDDHDLDLSEAMAIANAPSEDDAAPEPVSEEQADEADAEEDDDDAWLDDDGYDDASLFADDAQDAEMDEVAEASPAPEVARPRPVARVLKVKRRDFEDAVRDGALEEEDTAPVPDAISRGESTLSPEDETELQNELAALEEEIARGATPVDPVQDTAEDDTSDEDAMAFDAEDDDVDFDFADQSEDETAEEDAAAWALDDTEDAPAPAADIEDDAVAAEQPADDVTINPRRRLLRKADDDMDRIMAETDNQLGDSDGTRRRSAIAHLRAAVAATKAEKQAGAVTEDDEQEVADVYRDDLAQVVRPRRPVARNSGPSRRTEDRPAPLKLVAEQRVDIPGPDKANGPVRPRRVRMSDLAEQDPTPREAMASDAEAHARVAAANAASFNEFAERVGAASLPDLLEAAASYLAFVEERDQFSRPQLMGKARQALGEEFSREDGLRHFGRLLREGKLRKVSAGRFTVSDRINFRPEERAAG